MLIGTALIAGAATADRPRQDRPVKADKPVPSSTAIATARAIAKRVKAIAVTDAKLRKTAGIAAKKKGTRKFDLPIYAVADGNALYSTVIKVELSRDEEDLLSLRMVLERIDRSTGAKVELLNKRNTYPLGVYARGGSVGIETVAVKETGRGKNSRISAKTAIYTAAHTDPALKAIDVTELKLDRDEDVCGKFTVLAGLSDKADPLVAAIDARCDANDDRDIEELTAELQLWQADGARKPLGPAAIDSAFFGSGFVLTGSKLLQPDPYQPGTSLQDLTTGKLASLWTPEAGAADLADDGSVALIGWPAENLDAYFEGDYEEQSETLSTTAAPSTNGPPPIPTKRPPRKFPLVVFPGGDAENPVLVNASRQGVMKVKFCGPNLFVLDRIESSSYEGTLGDFDEFFLFAYQQASRIDIQLYDAQGHLVRSLVKTHPLAFAGVGCNGDKLILISMRKDKYVTTEIGT